MSMSQSTYRPERARQTEILHTAIERTIQETGQQFEHPMLNAVIGALVASLAETLAAIGDHRLRKDTRKTIDGELSRQIAELLADGRPSAAVTVVKEGFH